jgi:hypothetical protein
VLSASEFRPGEREPLVQVAQAGALSRSQQGLLPAILLDRFNRDRPGADNADDIPVLLRSPMAHTGVGPLYQSRNATLEEVSAMCPRFARTQRILNEEAGSMLRRYDDPAEYGRVLHTRVADRINAMRLPDGRQDLTYRAEVTQRDGEDASMNSRGSSRVDVNDENPARRLLCIYNHKTGRGGFSARDMEREARNFINPDRGIDWVVTVEMRPRVGRW